MQTPDILSHRNCIYFYSAFRRKGHLTKRPFDLKCSIWLQSVSKGCASVLPQQWDMIHDDNVLLVCGNCAKFLNSIFISLGTFYPYYFWKTQNACQLKYTLAIRLLEKMLAGICYWKLFTQGRTVKDTFFPLKISIQQGCTALHLKDWFSK